MSPGLHCLVQKSSQGYDRSVSRWEGRQVGVGIANKWKDRGTEGGTVDNRWLDT